MLSTAAAPARAEPETIPVIGERKLRESERLSRTGSSLLIQPRDDSRFDTLTQLKRESSLTFSETGRVSPSGFLIPKIRGQDSKLTDVYFEDVLLQDPYSGLPLIEDLDLRAFGSMELHQGIAPVSVPNINAVGTIRYRFQDVAASRYALGLTLGEPYGHTQWVQAIQKHDAREVRVYARQHETRGRYRFYSDEGTPLNASDDTTQTRANNDQRSNQFIPVYRERFGDYTLQALAWAYEANRGIASSSMVLPSDAREHNRGFLADASLKRVWQDLSLVDSIQIGAHVSRTQDRRELDDPSRRILQTSRQTRMIVTSMREGIHLKTSSEPLETTWSWEGSESTIEQSVEGRPGTALDRRHGTALLGFAYLPREAWLIEAKASRQNQSDQNNGRRGIIVEGEDNPKSQNRRSAAHSLSIAYGDTEAGSYIQIARTERLPSLLEEFGNGGALRPNRGLETEKIFHREWGGFLPAFGFEFGAAYYDDQTEDKIVIVPILANASKALNIARTDVRGADGSVTWNGRRRSLSFKGSRLEAYDSSRKEPRKLPGIPDRVGIAEWREQWTAAWVSYLTSRYRSDVYRDLGHSTKLPGSWIYDLNVDYKRPRLAIGLSLRNLLDTQDVEIASGSKKGRTAFSDIAGAPLPGRQWILSIVTNTED